MKIAINKQSPFGIKQQITRQLRILIESGDLAPGQPLPSVRDLAAMLNVNRNTASLAYRELASEGFVRMVAGSGTYVREGHVQKHAKALKGIFQEAVEKAKALGLSVEQAGEFFMNQLSTYSVDVSSSRVLVVDCNKEAVDHICTALEDELDVQTEGVTIQSLEEDPARAMEILADKDLVVCGLNHVPEFRQALPECPREVVGVMFSPDVRILNHIIGLPPGTRVGYCCANQRSTENLYNSSFFAGGTELRRILAGLDNPARLRNMLEACDVIFVTNFIYERIRGMVGPEKQVIRVDLSIEPGNIELVQERLKAARGRVGRRSDAAAQRPITLRERAASCRQKMKKTERRVT